MFSAPGTLPKQRIGRRRNGRAERRVGDHAAGLRRAAAQRDVLERAADILALRHRHGRPQQKRGHESAPGRACRRSRSRSTASGRLEPCDGRSARRRGRGCRAAGSSATRRARPCSRARGRPIGDPSVARRSAASVICRYIGAKMRHCDAKRANCARTTVLLGAGVMSLLPPGSIDTVGIDVKAIDRTPSGRA